MADNFDINLGAELRRQRETIILLFFVLKRAKQCHFMRFCAVSFPRCIFYSYHNRITANKKTAPRDRAVVYRKSIQLLQPINQAVLIFTAHGF